MSEKPVLDLFADAFLGVLRKGAAEGAARVVRHVGGVVAGKVEKAAGRLEKEARCTCVGGPRSVCMERADVEAGQPIVELVTVHGSHCPAR